METPLSGSSKSFNLFLSNTNYNILPILPTHSQLPTHLGESRETQLSTSYNLLAKQLHDTECHVIQLRKALSDMRSKLMEIKNKNSSSERSDRLHGGIEDKTRIPGISRPSHTLSDILNDSKSPRIDSPPLNSSSSSSSSSSSPRQPAASESGAPPLPPSSSLSTNSSVSSLASYTSANQTRRICDVDELLTKIERKLRCRPDYDFIRQAINDAVQENMSSVTQRCDQEWGGFTKFRSSQGTLPYHPHMANFAGSNFMTGFLPDFYRYATQHRLTFYPQIIESDVQKSCSEKQTSLDIGNTTSLGTNQTSKNLFKVGSKSLRDACLNTDSRVESCQKEDSNAETPDVNGGEHCSSSGFKNTVRCASSEQAGFNLSNGAIQTPWDSTQRLVANELRSGDEVGAAPKDTSLVPSVQSLDTAEVAQRIREILSAHNIGQRLFARHVLGLSQGTVSELLSKPKHWDKLTEKGRESYRRMYLWAANENNIATLKSFAPKKGTNVVMSNNDADDTETEEKIAQILSEAKVAMQMKSGSSLDESASTLVANIYYQELARLNQSRCSDAFLIGKDKISGRGTRAPSFVDFARQKRVDSDSSNENFSRNVVAQIYQEELRKLAETAEMNGNADDANLYKREIARISEVLNQNKLKFSHEALEATPSSEANDDKENNFGNQSGSSAFAGSLVKMESYSQSETQKSEENESYGKTSNEGNIPQDLRTNKSSESGYEVSEAAKLKYPFTYMPVASHGNFKGKETIQDQTVSPLQQMQSIASSLLIKSQRPLRAVLPPITQEQLDMYSEIDTEELVKKVKDLLSQYSISQRLFGEMVLGLSQGSVSDLLARPKPWLMLTQKGREPFIRMQIFLDDETAITKLVAAQFQTPAEKLLRMSNHTDLKGVQKLRHSPQNSTGSPHHIPNIISTLQYGNKYLGFMNHDPIPFRSSKLPPVASNSFLVGHASDNYFDKPIKYEPSVDMKSPFDIYSGSNMFLPKTSLYSLGFYQPSTIVRVPQFGSSVENEFFPNISTPKPSDSSPELDTFEITTKVKEVLQFHNLGQKLFGEAVLGLSQGSVSELLSKPKPWHMLSLKGREPFLKMHMWLLDPLSINRLKIYQDQIKTKKRKSANDESNLNEIQQKKTRVFFSEEQKHSLRQAYAADPYPSQSTLDELASDLGVATKTVINWFHNYRMRAKQQLKSTNSCSIPTSLTNPASEVQSMNDKIRDDAGSFGSDEDCLDQEITVDDDLPEEGMSTAKSLQSNMGHVSKEVDLKMEDMCRHLKRDDETTVIKSEEFDSTYDSLEIGSCMFSSGSIAKQMCSNKRKSAKPQWVYEGTQLVKGLYETSSENKTLEEVKSLGLDCDGEDVNPNEAKPDQ